MGRIMHLAVAALLILLLGTIAPAAPRGGHPNVIVILADDVGYGDLGCYGATKIKTPNLDRLAKQGMRFTDGYAPASVCTPTRYALLTGQYAWRNDLGSHILPGTAPLSIRPGSVTLPGVLRDAGYATGIVGKWHLGLGDRPEAQDWNGDVKPGPLEIGFQYSFIIPATGDRVPCVYLEDHRVVGLDPKDPIAVSYGKRIGYEPTGADPQGMQMKLKHKDVGHGGSIVSGIPRIGFMTGGQSARWVDEQIPDLLTAKAVKFIERNQDKPFFLYFAPHDIHAPRVAAPRFKGTSQCGIRGDVVQQLDWQAGEILAALDRLGLSDDTLVIFSSDNGGTPHNGYDDGGDHDLNGHQINGPLRGFKSSLYEGGSRVPLIARWPGHIEPGAESHAIACLVDLTATCAALTGRPLPDGAARDGVNLLPVLTGESTTSSRVALVTQANQGRSLAVRKGDWKLVEKPAPRRKGNAADGADLYNLANDLAEAHDVAAEHPDVVKDLTAELARARQDGAK